MRVPPENEPTHGFSGYLASNAGRSRPETGVKYLRSRPSSFPGVPGGKSS